MAGGNRAEAAPNKALNNPFPWPVVSQIKPWRWCKQQRLDDHSLYDASWDAAPLPEGRAAKATM